jgi:GMP synthase-like glutamine amidotransferase
MHVALLNANVDRSAFARGWPDDAEKVATGLRPHRPGWHYRVWQACDGELPPEHDEADAWVITGSVASVNDEAPWMRALEQRVRARHERRQPTAGLCFGHQLIAKALGGRVGPSPGGWRLGVAETLFSVAPPAWMQPPVPALRLFALHQEQVLAPPPAARVLGGDAFTPHAALQVGQHVFTTQYHPELSREFVLAVLQAHGDEWPVELVARARAEFAGPVDAERFMQWLAQFLEGAAGAPAAGATRSSP